MLTFLIIYGVMALIYAIVYFFNAIEYNEPLIIKFNDITNIIKLLGFLSSFPTVILLTIGKLIYKFLTCDFRSKK